MALGYKAGSPVPVYRVMAIEELDSLWAQYSDQYGNEARLAYLADEYELGPLAKQCLIDVAPASGGIASGSWTKLVVYSSCGELSVGNDYRLTLLNYCVESFGPETPDFYTTLGYLHAHIEEKAFY